jgi:hypothetical protein
MGLALCLGIVSCSSQIDTGAVSSNAIKTTSIEETRSLPKKAADSEKEKYMKDMMSKRAQTPIDGSIVNYQAVPVRTGTAVRWMSGCLTVTTRHRATDIR